MNEEEAKKSFKSLLRRTKYSMAIVGIMSHSLLSSFLFYRSDKTPEAYAFSDMVGIFVGVVFCAALIETGMIFIEKRLQ